MTYLNGKKLIGLPCTAHDLEVALHAQCDHDGLWGGQVYICGNGLYIVGEKVDAINITEGFSSEQNSEN